MKELLSPAGNMDCLKAAIHNGADAVYLGGKLFGARKFASNFDREELKEAVYYSHLYGVKVYVTVNTIIYDEEIPEFMDYIDYLYNIGIDALIMQDIGMIYLVRKRYPNFEINASTQIHNHNNEGIKLLKELGIKKVVLDRELSLDEVENLDNSIEKEVFIHGALCDSYSGCCLISSMNGGRSGNRGECVQSCRLPYKLIKNGKYIDTDNKYLLSTKELNTIDNFDKLMKSSVSSFKIEGRMKSPSYVGYVTKIYRKLIDCYNSGGKLTVNKEEYNNLKILFNRDFTSGYLFNDKVMNVGSSNHQGLEIGNVIESTPKKIKIKLSNNLYQEDGIRFKHSGLGMIANFIYNEKDMLISKGNIGEIIYIDNKVGLKNNDIVLKTSSSHLENKILNTSEKKILIDVDIKSKGNKLLIIFSDDNNIVSDFIEISKAIKRPTSKEEIIEKISKLGSTPFTINNLNIDIDNDVFVSMKLLNELRRNLCDKLINERTKIIRENIKKDYKLDISKDNNSTYEISVLARNEFQVEAALSLNVDRIYIDNILYEKYKNYSNVYLRLPRVNKEYNYDSMNILATEYGAISKYNNKSINLNSDYYLNIVNSYGIKFLLDHNVKRVTISPEVNYDDLDNLLFKDKLELIVYGRLELMLTKSCPIREIINSCPCNKNDKYYLEDINGNRYPLIHNNCLTHIMHYKNIDYLDKIDYYKNIGIKSYRLELFDEDYEETIRLIKIIK